MLARCSAWVEKPGTRCCGSAGAAWSPCSGASEGARKLAGFQRQSKDLATAVYLLDASANDADREAVRGTRKKIQGGVAGENAARRGVLATLEIFLKGQVDVRRAGRTRAGVRVQMKEEGQAQVVQGAQGGQVAVVIHAHAHGGLLDELRGHRQQVADHHVAGVNPHAGGVMEGFL